VIVAVIPCLDEADSIGPVVFGIQRWVDHVVVVDNGSSDDTAQVAQQAGATVVAEPRRGYGRACLTGITEARRRGAEVVLFLDGDGSDHPDDAPLLLEPVRAGEVALCLGRRTARLTANGAMAPAQRFGNWLAPALMRVLFHAPYHDMPPFKAIDARALDRLALGDLTYGFTIEMLIKAHHCGLAVREVDVRHRARSAGESKVSGTVVGSVRASAKILSAIARHALHARRSR
jgi:glycosyltransferase involved in cell wall biosynthesis